VVISSGVVIVVKYLHFYPTDSRHFKLAASGDEDCAEAVNPFAATYT
jgi:hypothetical protein